jgi:superfamily I DNA and RNA helicase
MRTPAELFGVDDDGQPRVDLDRSARKIGLADYFSNDLVLYKCYRNPLDVLVCAHALGLGIYGPQIVQMLQNREHWEDVGYIVEEGEFTLGSQTVIKRPAENSPLSILEFEQQNQIIQVFSANSFSKELEWICSEVNSFISQGVRPEEILIICLDDRNAKNYFQALSQRFAEVGINSNDILANPMTPSRFMMDGRITLSTVHRAKGNEAALVFAIGIDAIAPERSSRKGRNKIFTAFTRAKCWLRVSGVAPNADPIFDEIKRSISISPKLTFSWPDRTKVDTLQRDISQREEVAKKLQQEYLQKMAQLGFSEEDAFVDLSVPEKSA